MKTTKTKFAVASVTNHYNPGSTTCAQQNVTLNAVYSSDPDSENYSFSKATPVGQITLGITNPDAFDTFASGGEFIVDFTPALRVE